MFLWSHEKQFWQPFRNRFAQKIRKFQKPFNFVTKKPQRCTSGHVDWSFDNNAEKFSPESIEFPLQVRNWQTENFSIYSIFPENVDLGTQNPALKDMLIFSGKTQLVFVLRRKKMATFITVFKEPSFFKMLPLTHGNQNKLALRSVFFCQTSGKFSLNVRKFQTK